MAVPAGLLGVPPVPSDDVVVDDPFAAGDARERSLAAARASTLILDGIVERAPQGFTVTTILRSPSGDEVGRAEGRGEVISTAIAIALEGLAADGRLPMASPTLPKDDYPQFTDSPTGAVLGLDLYRRVRSDADIADHCRRMLALDGEPLMKRILWSNCGEYATAGQTRPAFVPDGDSLTTLSFAAVGEGDELSPDARAALRSRIEQARRRYTSPAAQASLFDAEARLWMLDGDSVRARACALAALKLLPNDDVAVELVADADSATERSHATRRWAEAWVPYYLYLDGKTPDERLRQLRRHYELAGAAGPNPGLSLGPVLIEQGLIAEARALSADFLAGPPRLKRVADKLLSDLAIADGAFGRARELLDSFLASTPPPSWSTPEIGALNRMLRLSELSGTSQATADHLLDSFFFKPDKFVYSYPGTSWIWVTLLGTCWRASPDRAKRCVDLFDKTRAISDFDGTLKGAYTAYVDAVKAYVRGDKHAAVRAWKRVPTSDTIYPLMVDVSAFDAIGAGIEASAIDVELMKQTTSNYRGVTMAHVREARRAAKRGDKKRASELARAVVQAWGGADVPVPAVDEMRALQ
ncbi:MAG: hypothetical protein JNK04_15075 [Myxococcales bacterium]|nr:hypothetical protein [Myxococcales bacterium]